MFFEIAQAAQAGSIDPQTTYEISDVIRVSIAVVVLVAGGLSVVFVIWWGIMLILSGGKDEKVKPAVNSIRYALVGIIVIIISLFVLPKIGDTLNLGVSRYIAPDSIFQTVRSIATKLFGTKDGTVIPNSQGGTTSPNSLPDNFSDL